MSPCAVLALQGKFGRAAHPGFGADAKGLGPLRRGDGLHCGARRHKGGGRARSARVCVIENRPKERGTEEPPAHVDGRIGIGRKRLAPILGGLDWRRQPASAFEGAGSFADGLVTLHLLDALRKRLESAFGKRVSQLVLGEA